MGWQKALFSGCRRHRHGLWQRGDDGFVKIIVGESKKIVGVHIVGPYASILVQPFVYLMHAGHRCPENKKASQRGAHHRRIAADVPSVWKHTHL
jgi:pyruvate/2-oxoglutarate dehydrogenase complex dihydrolipoamide dehydrogenase (E3) component